MAICRRRAVGHVQQIEAWTPCREGNQGLSVDMLTQLERNTYTPSLQV